MPKMAMYSVSMESFTGIQIAVKSRSPKTLCDILPSNCTENKSSFYVLPFFWSSAKLLQSGTVHNMNYCHLGVHDCYMYTACFVIYTCTYIYVYFLTLAFSEGGTGFGQLSNFISKLGDTLKGDRQTCRQMTEQWSLYVNLFMQERHN